MRVESLLYIVESRRGGLRPSELIRIIILLIFFLTFTFLFAQQTTNDEIDNPPSEDFFYPWSQIPQNQKSATQAMMMSALFPGAGQFYVNKRNILAYIFPIVEISLWYTASNYRDKGDKLTRKFERYADEHYDLDQQMHFQLELIKHSGSHWVYDPENPNGHVDFRLDKSDRQHYHEDIGKYDKYIMGWDDWKARYVDDNGYTDWRFNEKNIWIGNVPINNPNGNPDRISANRKKYIAMRMKANEHYETATNMNFLIVLNHGVSAYDASRVARVHNKKMSVTPTYKMTIIDNNLVPLFGFDLTF